MANQITPAEALQAFTLFLSFREALEKTEIGFTATFTHENNAVEIEFSICDIPFNYTYRIDAYTFADDLTKYCEDICEPIQSQWHADRCSELESNYYPNRISVEYDSDEEQYSYSGVIDEEQEANLEKDISELNGSKIEIENRFFELFGKF